MSNKEENVQATNKVNTKIHPVFIALGVFMVIAIPSVWWVLGNILSPLDEVPFGIADIITSYAVVGVVGLILTLVHLTDEDREYWK